MSTKCRPKSTQVATIYKNWHFSTKVDVYRQKSTRTDKIWTCTDYSRLSISPIKWRSSWWGGEVGGGDLWKDFSTFIIFSSKISGFCVWQSTELLGNVLMWISNFCLDLSKFLRPTGTSVEHFAPIVWKYWWGQNRFTGLGGYYQIWQLQFQKWFQLFFSGWSRLKFILNPLQFYAAFEGFSAFSDFFSDFRFWLLQSHVWQPSAVTNSQEYHRWKVSFTCANFCNAKNVVKINSFWRHFWAHFRHKMINCQDLSARSHQSINQYTHVRILTLQGFRENTPLPHIYFDVARRFVYFRIKSFRYVFSWVSIRSYV